MTTAKNVLEAYKNQKKEIVVTEQKVQEVTERKRIIEGELISLNEKLIAAERDKKEALEKFALDELAKSEVEKTKGIFLKLQDAIFDRQEMVTFLETKTKDLQKDLNDLRRILKESEKALWRAIFDDYAREIRTGTGDNFEKAFIAFHGGGSGFFNIPMFFNEVFCPVTAGQVKLMHPLWMSPEKFQKVRSEISKEWGI